MAVRSSSFEPSEGVFKRCGCRNPATGRRLGTACPLLDNPDHGSWYFAAELPREAGRRVRLRRGGYTSCALARVARENLLASPRGLVAGRVWTVERWLRTWLDLVDVYLRPTTLRGYREHVHRYLLPSLGHHTLAELGTRDVQQMLRGLATHRTLTGRLMAPATIARILATLRTALAAAVREGLIAVNPAAAARVPRPAGCHPVVWTSKREQAWRAGEPRPPVAVWDTHHLAAFLRGCRDDRFFALWWLAALCGLRRGELCGLTWSTVDLAERTLTVAEQVVCVDGRIHVGPPKSLASRRTIALDDATVAVLRHHRRQQQAEAEEWTVDSRGHVFTLPDGRPVLPSVASHTFTRRVRAQHLPPVRLHDLRHGAASLNFAAHDDLKAVQALLGHSSPVTTAKIYISVLPELARRRAQATANMLLTAARVKPDAGSSQA
jgi:integrase